MGPSQENGEKKRARFRDSFDNNTAGSPSTSTASPEVCSSQIVFSLDADGDQAAWKDNETTTKDDDDDIMIIESSSSARPNSATGTFNIANVKSERNVSEEESEKQMECVDSHTIVSIETTAAAPRSVSSSEVSIGTQTRQNPVVKQEEGDSERKKKEKWSNDGESCSNRLESEKDTKKELESRNEELRVPILEEENQERNKTKSTVKSEDLSLPVSQTSAISENSVLDVLEFQKQHDKLLEILEETAKDQNENHAKLEELKKELLELTQSTLKKEYSHHSTQTSPDEAQDYKELYLKGKDELKQLQDELSELKMEKEERKRKGQEASLECDDDLACEIDLLLRELDQRNKEREELKDKVSERKPDVLDVVV